MYLSVAESLTSKSFSVRPDQPFVVPRSDSTDETIHNQMQELEMLKAVLAEKEGQLCAAKSKLEARSFKILV